MNNASSCFVVARSITGTWYYYGSTFDVAAYAGRTDCFACGSASEAWDLAVDLNSAA